MLFKFLCFTTCFAPVWSSWKNGNAKRGRKIQEVTHPKDPACHLQGGSGLWPHLLQLYLSQGTSAGLWVLPPQLSIPSVPALAKIKSTPDAASVWSTTEAVKTNIHTQQRQGGTTIYQKMDSRPAAQLLDLAKQRPTVRNCTCLVFPYTVVAAVVMSISILHKSIAEPPTKKGSKNGLF